MISLFVVVLMVSMIVFGLFMVFRLNKREPLKRHIDPKQMNRRHSHSGRT